MELVMITTQLKLKLNTRLRGCMRSRVEYEAQDLQDDLRLMFEVHVKNNWSGARLVTETAFARTKKAAGRAVGIFGTGDPCPAIRLVLQSYPDAMIMVRRDPPASRAR